MYKSKSTKQFHRYSRNRRDGVGTLNISTATAFVVAGAGVTVAKHGNKNLSSKSGAADALSASGVNVMVGKEVVEKALAEVGIGFMMAPIITQP